MKDSRLRATVTYTERPSLDGFSIEVPPGKYTPAELMDLTMFEYQWQCDEARTRTIAIETVSPRR